MYIIWILLMIAAILVEAATFTLVSIWFAVGALAAVIAAVCGASVMVQIIVFLIVSVGAMLVTRPFLKKFMPNKYIPTNGELDIGKNAIVIEKIDAVAGTGRVRVEGVDWGAKTADGAVIDEGVTVVIKEKGAAFLTVEKIN